MLLLEVSKFLILNMDKIFNETCKSLLPKKYIKYFVVVIAAAFVMFFVALRELPDGKFHIWFLDVGQGDSVLVETPEAAHILIDGGPKTKVMEELADVLPFFAKEIDLMVLTHPHSDHLEGLVEVLKRYKVHAILMTGIVYKNSYYEEFLKEVNRLSREKDLKVYIADDDLDFRIGSVEIDVIYPFESLAGKTIANLNNSSIAMMVKYGEEKILLTGDGEVEVENEILEKRSNLKADVFKAPHHGSKTASSCDFVKAVSPKTIVIQVGTGNKFGHPHAETLRTYHRTGVEKVFRNDVDGRVEFVF